MKTKFYCCKHCGNMIGFIRNTGVPIFCCGEPMGEMPINSQEASGEKHLPVAQRDGDNIIIKVGEVVHPMSEEHFIDWIYLETIKGGQRKLCLDSPSAVFALVPGDMPIAAYAYCNLHGLWRTLL